MITFDHHQRKKKQTERKEETLKEASVPWGHSQHRSSDRRFKIVQLASRELPWWNTIRQNHRKAHGHVPTHATSSPPPSSTKPATSSPSQIGYIYVKPHLRGFLTVPIRSQGYFICLRYLLSYDKAISFSCISEVHAPMYYITILSYNMVTSMQEIVSRRFLKLRVNIFILLWLLNHFALTTIPSQS